MATFKQRLVGAVASLEHVDRVTFKIPSRLKPFLNNANNPVTLDRVVGELYDQSI